MADVTLAEFSGSVWLVGGEQYIDDLLMGTLAKEISIELVPCEQKSEVHKLWAQLCGPRETFGEPWIIHPGIVARIRRTITSEYSVFFAEWSVALDNDARTVIASAANWAIENVSASVVIVEFVEPNGPKSIVDLSSLRAQLVTDALLTAGVAASRISRSSSQVGDVAGMQQESQRIDITFTQAEPAT
jgi:outer membrane protein OmpA-like peptidoglycan-associated protein